jgi:hypothetical protein
MELVTHRQVGTGGAEYALLYPIRPGRADIAAKVLAGSGDPPLQAGATRLLRTRVLRHHDTIVRLFTIDGDVADLVEHLARAVEVHQVGERMAGLFAGEYDFTTAEGLRQFFTDGLMDPVGAGDKPVTP